MLSADAGSRLEGVGAAPAGFDDLVSWTDELCFCVLGPAAKTTNVP